MEMNEMTSQHERPNIVLVLWHDLGDWLGCYGYQPTPSPHADALSRQGVRLTNYFSACPICCPSRAAMLTGLLPHANGVNGQINRGWDLDRHISPLAQILRDEGYTTYLVGFSHACQDPTWEGFDNLQGGPDPEQPAKARAIFERHSQQTSDDSPFFLTLTTQAVHRPFGGDHNPGLVDQVSLPPYLPDLPAVREDVACLHHYIAQADDQLGQILTALDETGLTQETLFIFTTDHGAAFGRAKATLYDPGLKISFLARWPGVISPHSQIDALLSNVDFTPTILDLVGISHPQAETTFHGQSFAALLRHEPYHQHRAIYAEHTYGVMYYPARAIRTERYKYIVNFRPNQPLILEPHIITRCGEQMVNQYYSSPLPGEELYDLQEDPHEFHNLANKFALRTGSSGPKKATIYLFPPI